jgi:hypothetical protein
LRRQLPALVEKDVGVEPRPLVPGPHLGDEPEDADGLAVRELPLERDHVVELEELAVGDRDPELEGGSVLGADDPAGYRGFGHSA